MIAERSAFSEIVVKTIIVHTVTYFFVGVLAFITLDYATRYAAPAVAAFARSTNDPLVAAGPLFQLIRGLLFGILFYLLREPFFHRPNGWLLLWATLVIVGIIGPFLAGPGTLEGLVYSRLPLDFQLISLPEVLIQSLVLAGLLFYWVRHPQNRWLSWVLGIACSLIIVLTTLGLVARAAT